MSTKEKNNGMVSEPVVVGYGMQTHRHDIGVSPVLKHISLSKLERESMTLDESELILTDVVHKQYSKLT